MSDRPPSSPEAHRRHARHPQHHRRAARRLRRDPGAHGFFGDPEGDKTGDVNANLWAGLALLVVAVVFIAWARLRPIVVPEDVVPVRRATAPKKGKGHASSELTSDGVGRGR